MSLSLDERINVAGLTSDRMRAIYYVGMTQSVTRASEMLCICQSAVTRQIQVIEERLGFKLFERADRKVSITEEGELIFQLAKRTLFDADAVRKSLKERKEGMSGPLVIRTSPSMANTWLPYYLQDFHQKYPKIRIKTQSTSHDISLLDADIMIRTYVPKHEDLCQLKLFDNTMGLFASHGYIQQYGEPKSLEDLDNHRLLAIDRDLEQAFDYVNWVLKVGIQDKLHYRKPCMELGSSSDAVAAGLTNNLGITSLGVHYPVIAGKDNIIRVLGDYKSEPLGMYFIYNNKVSHGAKYLALYNFFMEKISTESSLYKGLAG